MTGDLQRDDNHGRRDAALAPSTPAGRVRPRLAGFDCIGRYAYHLVINTNHRGAALRDSVAAAVVEDLSRAALQTSFELLAFCVMPDHVHILALGARDDANAVSFMQRFKQLTGFRFSKTHAKPFWQQSFYDHAVRLEEELLAIARYIFDNPVEAGLIAAGERWAFQGGSLVAADGAIMEERDGAKAASLRADGAEAPSLRDAASPNGAEAPSLRDHILQTGGNS